MKRKYDLRNKRNFVIILILGLFIIGIFSLFVYKYLHASKIVYNVSVGSILQDTNKNYINIEDDAVLKTRWNGTYFLNYQDNNIGLGKRVVIYNDITGKLNLYGKFYQINDDGKIKEYNGETLIDNTSKASFYKLADREYLLVDKQIVSEDRSINAVNYLLVELDRMGNAKLSNSKLNLKTITPTKLITSEYTFDIANEILKFNKLEVDLKKIIGTTNEYKEEKEEETEANNNADGNGVNTWTIDNNIDVNNLGGGVVGNNGGEGEATTLDEIKNKIKSTSIIRWNQGLTQIDIDYVVYDPFDQYKSIYIEVSDGFKHVELAKNETHVTINGLVPDKEYKLSFVYTVVDSETNEVNPSTFEELYIKTKKPVYSGKVTGYSGYTHQISYKIDLQKGYAINQVNATLIIYHNVVDEEGNISEKRETLPIVINNISSDATYVSGVFNLDDLGINNITKLDMAKVIINSVTSGDIIINY